MNESKRPETPRRYTAAGGASPRRPLPASPQGYAGTSAGGAESLAVLTRRELREWERVVTLKRGMENDPELERNYAARAELESVRTAWYRRCGRIVRLKQRDFAELGARILVISMPGGAR